MTSSLRLPLHSRYIPFLIVTKTVDLFGHFGTIGVDSVPLSPLWSRNLGWKKDGEISWQGSLLRLTFLQWMVAALRIFRWKSVTSLEIILMSLILASPNSFPTCVMLPARSCDQSITTLIKMMRSY